MAYVIPPFLAFTRDISVSFGLAVLVCVIVFALIRRKRGPR